MAGQPITAGISRRVVLCALLALIGPGWSVSFGQIPPESPMQGPAMRPMLNPGPYPPMPNVGPAASAVAPPQPGGAAPVVPPEEMVVQVCVEGNKTIGLDKISPKIRTRIGRPYDEVQVEEDVKDLYKMGVFVYVRTLKQRVPGGVVVIFQVAERPLLKEVIIVGNDIYTTAALRREAELKVGDAADPFAVVNGARKIKDFYEKKGYSKVRVTILEGDKAGDLRAVIVVNEGPQQKVFWVNFVGNHFISAARLKTLIESHPPWFYLFSGEVDRKQIDEDVKKLTAYYRAFGFFKASVGRVLEFNEKQNWLTLTFVIDEGPRYSVRNVSFLGNAKFDNSRLAAKLKLLSGQVFDQNQQNLDLQKLRDEYGSDGYVFAKVEADNRFLDTPGELDKLDIVYNVEEGARYVVGRINIEIKGENPHTQIMPVLNKLSFKPGDIANTREFLASERRLKAAQIFKVDPQKGIEPKVVYSPPELEDKDTMVAGRPRTTNYWKEVIGDGPRPPLPPGVGYIDVNVSGELETPGPVGPPQNAPYPPAAYPPRTFADQSCQPSTSMPQVYSGQAYSLPLQGPQTPARYSTVPQTPAYASPVQSAVYGGGVNQAPGYWTPQPVPGPAVMQTRYEPDGWTPPQGQGWPPASSGNNGYSGGQSPQNYPAQQSLPAGTMVYNPPAAAPYGAPPGASPDAYASEPAYNPTTVYNASPSYSTPPASNAPPGYYAPPNYAAPAANPAYASPYPANPGRFAAGNPNASQGPYVPAGPPADRPVAQVAAAGDLFSNPEPMMVPTPTGDPLRDLPIAISPEETQSGRLMFGVGVNSDAGLVGTVTVDEQNFDIMNDHHWPTWEDVMEGRAFRGAGEKFRLELVPGTQVQRYMINFTEPNLNNGPVATSLGGFYYQRIYTQWSESRAGGNVSFGYQFTHDLTGSVNFQGQDVRIRNPEYPVPSLEDVVGHNQLYTFGVSLTHDTRDNSFMATEGHLLSGRLQETVGSFQYPTASVEWSQFFRIFERADRSGKHVLSLSLKAGYSGDNTPIFERYYAGGFSTLRGFAFRGVSPLDPVYQMAVGGDFQMLATAQYLFPITADDMLKGVVFVDAGTVEPTIAQWVDKVRVAPGFGLRISIPMMGPAPIALDFAFPISQQNGDQTQMFSFFVGFNH